MGLTVVRDFAFEISVGEVVQGDRGVQVKQVAGSGKQRVLKSRMAFPEDIGGTVQGDQWQRFVIHSQQLSQTTALAQPAVRRQFRPRCGHTRDNGADKGGALAAIDAQAGQQFEET